MPLYWIALVHRQIRQRISGLRQLILTGLFAVLFGAAACGAAAPEAAPTPILSPEALAGKAVFEAQCASCHSLIADSGIVGPSMAGIATQAHGRVPEQDARTYLYTSIMRPGAYLVDGYENLMPENFGKKLTGEEIDALVVFLLTLEQDS